MDRREFLTSTGGIAAAGAGLAAPLAAAASPSSPQIASSSRSLRIAVPQSIETLATGMAARRIAHRLQAALPDETLVDVVSVRGTGLDAIRAGEADAYYGLESDHAHLHPAFALFSGMPTGEHLGACEHDAWLVAAGGGELWQELSASLGLRAFAAGHTGSAAGLYSDRLVDRANDIAGMRIACRGLARGVAQHLGATVVEVDESAFAGAIHALSLDAAEPLTMSSQAVAQWTYRPGLMAGGMTMSLGFSAERFARFSRQEQAILESAAAEARAHSLAIASLEHATIRRVGHLRRWPISTAMDLRVLAAIEASSAAVVDAIAAVDPLAGRIVASHRSFRAALAGALGEIA